MKKKEIDEVINDTMKFRLFIVTRLTRTETFVRVHNAILIGIVLAVVAKVSYCWAVDLLVKK